MKINKLIINSVTTLVMLGASFVVLTAPVAADQDCENPGPYGVCVPETDIVIGELTLTNEMIAGIAGTYLIGVALVANGQVIKEKFSK